MAKMKKAVTMADIAEKMDVSIVTVSKALSGQKGVSEEVRAKIVALALELGYQMPRRLNDAAKKQSFRIGVLIPASAQGDSFYWKMYQSVADRAMEKDCFTSYEGLSREMTERRVLPRLISDRVVDGLIVIGRPGNNYGDFLKENAGIPLTFLDFYENVPEVDCFISDGFYGTYRLTNYLFERGHRDIAYVGTLFATESITDRYLGYLKSLMEHGVTPAPDYVIPDRSVEGGISENYQKYRLPEKMPTAFVCNCDYTASLLIRELKQKGLSVPEDVSVVGFDNYLGTLYEEVGITTYAVDIPGMAEGAVRSLIRQMKGEKVKKGIHIVEGSLVEKDSVADIRRKETEK